MKREADLRRRLRSLQMLSEAVRAMKSLSAHHFRQVRGAVEPARAYRAGVERIARWTGASLPAGRGAAGLLVIGGELGLCGSYNARVATAAAARRRELGAGPTFCVGHRTAILLARLGVHLDGVHGAPTSVDGVPELLLRVAEQALATYVGDDLSSLDVVSSRFGGVGAEAPAARRLLPLQPPAAGPGGEAPPPPVRYVSPDRIARAAAREYLYVVLYDVFLDALASEHGARLVATQSAESWLDERTEGLGHRLAAARREASTQEMIEIAAGARARG